MPTADFGRVPHERGDFIEALSLHREVASERMPEVEATPRQVGSAVELAQGLGEVVGIPVLPFARREVPTARHDLNLVALKVASQGSRNRDGAVYFRLRLPELPIDRLCLNVDAPVLPRGQADIFSGQPERFLPSQAGINVDGDHGLDERIRFEVSVL